MKNTAIQTLLAMLAFLFASTAVAGETEDRNKIMTEVTYCLQTNDFTRLETLGNRLINPNERLPSGVWKFYWYAKALTDYMGKDLSPSYWSDMEKKAKAWINKYPKSSNAKIFFAKTYIQHAWAFRGSGYASDVSDEDWDEIKKYANLSYKVLIDNPAAKENPDWYPTMFDVLALKNNSRQAFIDFISEGAKRHPSYHDIYFSATWYLTPQWGGSHEAIDSLALFSQKNAKATEGTSMYARIYWSANQAYYRGELFDKGLASWKIMKPSFDDLISRYPSSWNLNAYAYFSCEAKDRNTLKVLLNKIGDNIDMGAWGPSDNNRYKYLHCVKFSKGTSTDSAPDETHGGENLEKNRKKSNPNKKPGVPL